MDNTLRLLLLWGLIDGLVDLPCLIGIAKMER
jgi:hypothetical protein